MRASRSGGPGTRQAPPFVERRVLTLVRPAAAALGLTLAAAGAGCASAGPEHPAGVAIVRASSTSGLHGTPVDPPYRKPALTFTDTSGRPFRLDADTSRGVTLVFFGYTRCDDVCPAVLGDVAAALRGLDPGTRRAVSVVFVTTDPARDPAPVLRAYLDRFDPTIVGLTAPAEVVERAAASLGVALTGTRPVGDDYEVGHGTQLIGFGPDGLARVIWLPGTPVDDLRADIVRIASSA